MFSERTYAILKALAQIILPALGTLYAGIAAIWGLPYSDEVVGTILALDTFLGVLLGISTSKYKAGEGKYDGSIDVQTAPDTGVKTFSLNLQSDPMDLEQKNIVAFKVNST